MLSLAVAVFAFSFSFTFVFVFAVVDILRNTTKPGSGAQPRGRFVGRAPELSLVNIPQPLPAVAVAHHCKLVGGQALRDTKSRPVEGRKALVQYSGRAANQQTAINNQPEKSLSTVKVAGDCNPGSDFNQVNLQVPCLPTCTSLGTTRTRWTPPSSAMTTSPMRTSCKCQNVLNFIFLLSVRQSLRVQLLQLVSSRSALLRFCT